MSDLRKAAQMALEALENAVEYLPIHSDDPFDDHFEAIKTLKAALAQPEQEPEAFFTWRDMVTFARNMTEEIETIINDNTDGDGICCADDLLAAIRAHGIGSHDA